MKLSESSKAVMLLRKRLCNGDISYSDISKSVSESDPTFMAHKRNTFPKKIQ